MRQRRVAYSYNTSQSEALLLSKKRVSVRHGLLLSVLLVAVGLRGLKATASWVPAERPARPPRLRRGPGPRLVQPQDPNEATLHPKEATRAGTRSPSGDVAASTMAWLFTPRMAAGFMLATSTTRRPLSASNGMCFRSPLTTWPAQQLTASVRC